MRDYYYVAEPDKAYASRSLAMESAVDLSLRTRGNVLVEEVEDDGTRRRVLLDISHHLTCHRIVVQGA